MLDNKDEKNPFTVPENYFQNFNAEIMNKISEEQVVDNKKTTPLWKHASRWISAAVIIGVAFLGVNHMNDSSTPSNNGATSEVLNNQDRSNINDDYYDFIQEEATQIAYKDVFFSDEF